MKFQHNEWIAHDDFMEHVRRYLAQYCEPSELQPQTGDDLAYYTDNGTTFRCIYCWNMILFARCVHHIPHTAVVHVWAIPYCPSCEPQQPEEQHINIITGGAPPAHVHA